MGVCRWRNISTILLEVNIVSILKRIRTPHTHEEEDLLEKWTRRGVKLGEGVRLVDEPNFGSEPWLISIGAKTTVSFDVAFVTHDAATRVIRNLPDGNPETVIYGPIHIGENCFVGCRSVILPNVTIGDNCIIGAGSIVNRSIPANCVAAGNPCRVICTLDEYREKHNGDFLYMVSLGHEEKRKYLTEHFGIN